MAPLKLLEHKMEYNAAIKEQVKYEYFVERFDALVQQREVLFGASRKLAAECDQIALGGHPELARQKERFDGAYTQGVITVVNQELKVLARFCYEYLMPQLAELTEKYPENNIDVELKVRIKIKELRKNIHTFMNHL